jgi:hypothetical protein
MNPGRKISIPYLISNTDRIEPKDQHPLYYKRYSYNGSPVWFPLLRIIARLARLADRMLGGPLFRSVKRPAVWPHRMVGGRIVNNCCGA